MKCSYLYNYQIYLVNGYHIQSEQVAPATLALPVRLLELVWSLAVHQ